MSDLLIGLEEIARYLRMPLGTLKRHSRQLQNAGVVFRILRGKPPRPMICAFKNMLQAWFVAGSMRDDEE